MLAEKTLLDCTNIFSPIDYKKNDKIIYKYFKDKSYCAPPPLSDGGGVEPLRKFSKVGLDRILVFRGGCWQKAILKISFKL